jgi:hypothetical protein
LSIGAGGYCGIFAASARSGETPNHMFLFADGQGLVQNNSAMVAGYVF